MDIKHPTDFKAVGPKTSERAAFEAGRGALVHSQNGFNAGGLTVIHGIAGLGGASWPAPTQWAELHNGPPLKAGFKVELHDR